MEELTNIACLDEESRFIYKTVSTIIIKISKVINTKQ
jgi:hypothetical protein